MQEILWGKSSWSSSSDQSTEEQSTVSHLQLARSRVVQYPTLHSEKCLLGSIHSYIVIGWKRTSAVSLGVLSYGRAHTTNQGNSIFNHVWLFVCLVPSCISHLSTAFLYHMTYQLQINEFLRGLIRWWRGGGGVYTNLIRQFAVNFQVQIKRTLRRSYQTGGGDGGCRQGCIEDLM